MKPLRLELRGFTAFRRPAVIDFRGRSLFAITGPTGAGKSSLLDAMTWALYGQVPRVGRSTHQLVTHGEKSMSVRFDFTARGRVYRVTRTTSGAIGTRIEERVSEEGGERWKLLADRSAEVTKQAAEVIGLDYATFIKTIVLPQGEFGSFLRGEERERRDILSTLLGLGAYESAGRAARDRAREAQQSASLLARQLEQLTYATPEALASLDAEREALARDRVAHDALRARLADLGTAAAVHTEALRALGEARRANETARQALAEAERALAETDRQSREARIDLDRLTAERAGLAYDPEAHQRLRQAVQLLDARETAGRALEAARAAEQGARTTLDEAQRLAATAEQRRAETEKAALAARAAHDAARDDLHKAVRHGHATVLGLRIAEDEADAAARAADTEAASLAETARQAEAFATEARALGLDVARTSSALVAARTEEAALRAATAASTQRATAAEVALGERRDALDATRTQHTAAALRAGLAPGAPCPVCGATATQLPLHAAPDLDAASAAVAEAEAVLRAALAEQQSTLARAAAASARLSTLDEEDARQRERRTALESDVRASGLPCDELDATALARAAAEAAEGARQAQLRATAARVQLTGFAESRHALELRLAEAAQRLGPASADADGGVTAERPAGVEAAREAGVALAAGIAVEVGHGDAARAAEDASRIAREAALRAADGAARAQAALAERSAAIVAAQVQLDSFAGGELDPTWGADPRAALAAQDELAATAARLDSAAQESSTALAVLAGRLRDRQVQVEGASAGASSAAASLEGAVRAAEEAGATFAGRWRDLLGDGEPPSVPALERRTALVEAEAREAAHQLGGVEARLEQARAEVEQAARLREEMTQHQTAASVAEALARELRADRFIAYVQREALAVLAADASSRLLHLTGGRYRLTGEEDEFYVIDHFNGDERRSVRTLSGGETFLASLALALALSERLPELAGSGGALSLESLFLDEGFGSLDAASLDVAIEGLERLAGGRRVIGVISHVPEIAERLPDRIEVLKAPDGSSIAAGRDAEFDLSDG